MATTVDDLKNSLRAHKGHFTRLYKAVERAADFAESQQTRLATEELTSVTTRFKAKYEDVISAYSALQIADPANYDAYYKAVVTTETEYQSLLEGVLKLQSTLEPLLIPAPVPAPAAGGGAAGGGGARPRVFDAFKPFILNRDHTPVELREWISRFTSYYNASHIEQLQLREQQAFFKSVIDPKLCAKLTDLIGAATPVFGLNGCIGLLQQEFQLKYPLFNRRLDYFQLKQGNKQKFTDFSSKLINLAAEADLATVDIDDLHVFRYISGCTDSKLQQKFLKEQDPTLPRLNAVARAYEASESAFARMHGSNSVNKVDGRNKSKNTKGGAQGSKGQGSKTKITRADIMGKCFCCGKEDHKLPDCPRKDSVTCNTCGKKGHLPVVCYSKKDSSHDKSKKGKKTPNVSRATSRQNSPETSDDEVEVDPKTSRVYVSPVKARPTTRAYISMLSTHARSRRLHNMETPRLSLTIQPRKGHRGTPFSVDALPDTGATRTVISLDSAKSHGFPIVRTHEQLYSADDSPLKCEGQIYISIEGVSIVPLVSSSITDDLIISWHDLRELGVIDDDFPRIGSCKCRLRSLRGKRKSDVTVDSISTHAADLDQDLASIRADYGDVLTTRLPARPMPNVRMKIDLVEGAIPRKVTTTKRIPIHWQKEANAYIESLIQDGIISPVNETTDWVSPGFVVQKKNGKFRLVTDYSHLNKYVKRPIHPFPSAQDIMKDIPAGMRWFCKMDALQGYHQVPLDEDSRPLTTFLLPMGKFQYNRGPQGLCSTNDVFCESTDWVIAAVPNSRKIVDDILVWARTKDELLATIRKILDNCRRRGVIMATQKIEIGEEMDFTGFHISKDGIVPDDRKLNALKNFPVPANLTELRSFLGLVNQLGQFRMDLTRLTAPLRDLTKKNVDYIWTVDHQAAFDVLRQELTGPMMVGYFKQGLKTSLLTDASSLHGLGYALVQYQEDGSPRLIQCGSRSLADAETRYAPCELECLAISWAVTKCDHFLRGNPDFTVVTDHEPLKGVFAKDLGEIPNPRLQRFRERLLPYTFHLEWTPGKQHLIADALSRAPVDSPDTFDIMDSTTDSVQITKLHNQACYFTPILESAKSDPEYQSLLGYLKDGVPLTQVPATSPARQFASVWHDLSLAFDDRLVVYSGDRLVIPRDYRKDILALLHRSHAGWIRTRKLAQERYYWPTMMAEIKQFVQSCSACLERLPSQQRESLRLSHADYPMEMVSVDLFSAAGKDYLVMIDRYSGFPFVARLRSTTTTAVLNILDSWFLDFGYPNVLRSDGGPQFRSEFEEFCDFNLIKKETSSPYYPQSNGLAEAAVKQTKNLLLKYDCNWSNFRPALLAWRNTPKDDGVSPAEMFFGQRQNFGLPSLRSPEIKFRPAIKDKRDLKSAQHKDCLDSHSVDLSMFNIGDNVLVQSPKTGTWSLSATVLSAREDGRSYSIVFDDGTHSVRNRRQLRLKRKKKALSWGEDKVYTFDSD